MAMGDLVDASYHAASSAAAQHVRPRYGGGRQLPCAWRWWAERGCAAERESTDLGAAVTVRDFWNFFESIPLGHLPEHTELYVYRDISERGSGGRLHLRAQNGRRMERPSHLWFDLCSALANEQLVNSSDISGVGAMVRPDGVEMDVWLRPTVSADWYDGPVGLRRQLFDMISHHEGSGAAVEWHPPRQQQRSAEPQCDTVAYTPRAGAKQCPPPPPPPPSAPARPRAVPPGHRKSRSAPQPVSQSFIEGHLDERAARAADWSAAPRPAAQGWGEAHAAHCRRSHRQPGSPPQHAAAAAPWREPPAAQGRRPHGQGWGAQQQQQPSAVASPKVAQPAARAKAHGPDQAQQQQQSAAFVTEGRLYPAGLTRKQRRALLFRGRQGHADPKDLDCPEGIFVGNDVPDGPVTSERYAELAASALAANAAEETARDAQSDASASAECDTPPKECTLGSAGSSLGGVDDDGCSTVTGCFGPLHSIRIECWADDSDDDTGSFCAIGSA